MATLGRAGPHLRTAFFVALTFLVRGKTLAGKEDAGMAEEQEPQTAEGTQSQDVSDAGVAEKGASTTGSQQNWESQYKEMQGKLQKEAEERQRLQDTIDTVYPYIDFDRMQSGGGNREGSDEPQQEVTRDDLLKLERNIDSKLHTLDFRQKYPELRDYEEQVGAKITALRQTVRGLTTEQLIDKAATSVKEFLEKEREKGRAEAEKKKAQAAEAGGLGTATGSSTKDEAQSEGESLDEYLARHKKESAKKRGFL